MGGPDTQENPNVTRVAAMNLVVFGAAQQMGLGWSAGSTPVAEQRPSQPDNRAPTNGRGRAAGHGRVSMICHLPALGMPQVCSRRITLRAGPNAIDLLPGAVRPLLETELPFVLSVEP